MKKNSKTNILNMKKRPKRLCKDTQQARFKSSVKAYFFIEDEQPSRELGQAREVYEDYKTHCLLEGLSHCSQSTFGNIAREFVEKSNGPLGRVYYSLKPHVFNYLVTLSSGGEFYKQAA